ncbi:hypothetical protein ANN_08252 [Periplaneta americana]|uniref:Uncharacterized protein n=1 Tax=Periplaneta americana TaxID=6978 RepID=A0ABQ8T349_PERAM|nr:hypothetical protein ANN_08252 [Periplaneta americana]
MGKGENSEKDTNCGLVRHKCHYEFLEKNPRPDRNSNPDHLRDRLKVSSLRHHKDNKNRSNGAETDQEEEKKLVGSLAEKKLPLKDALEGIVNGRRVQNRRRYQLIDDIKIQADSKPLRQALRGDRNHPHHTMFARFYQLLRDDGSLRPRRIGGRPRRHPFSIDDYTELKGKEPNRVEVADTEGIVADRLWAIAVVTAKFVTSHLDAANLELVSGYLQGIVCAGARVPGRGRRISKTSGSNYLQTLRKCITLGVLQS